MKLSRKNLSILLVLLLNCTILFHGCTSESPDSINVNVAKTGFPIVDEVITLHFMAPQGPQHNDFSTFETFHVLEEKTNIHIKWTMVPEHLMDERRNLAFATGDLPDAFFGMDIPSIDAFNYGSQGILINLSSLIDEYAPNLTTLFTQYPELRRQQTAADGKIYTLGEISKTPRDITHGRVFINKVWMDELGLSTPTTADELYDVLSAFKSNDHGEIKSADVIPLGTLLYPDIWGISNIRDVYIDIYNGKPRFIGADSRYRQYLEYHHKLYAEGLLDREVFVQTRAQSNGKAQTGVVGTGVWNAPEVVAGIQFRNDYTLINPPLIGPNNDQMVVAFGSNIILHGGEGAFAITNVNRYPEATLRWVDWLFSVEGDMLFLSGIEGTHYERLPNGEWRLLVPEGKSRVEFMGTYTFTNGGIFPRLYTGEEWALLEERVAGGATDVAESAAATLAPYAPKEILPILNFTLEEQERINILQADIVTYMDLMTTRFVSGAESFSNWDNHIDTLNRMGMPELLQIYTNAYERFVSN